MFNKLFNLNYLFIFIVILLISIGSVALYSAGEGSFNPWAKKHIIRFVFFFFIMVIISLLDVKLIYRYAYIIFFLALILLFSVEIIGTFGKGAERWIRLFGISIQPSEIIKISIILALAKYYHSIKLQNIGSIKYLFFPLIIIITPFFFSNLISSKLLYADIPPQIINSIFFFVKLFIEQIKILID